jgi:hypothetical protein
LCELIDAGTGLVSFVGEGLEAIASWLGAVVSDIASWVEDAVEWIIDNLSLELGASVSVPIDFGPQPEESSPWGDAFKMWSCGDKCGGSGNDIAVYCVDCGFHGDLETGGSIRVSPILGVLGGTVEINGNLKAGLNLGLDAQGGVFKDNIFKKQLLAIGLTPYQIPGVIVVGPMLKVDIDADIDVKSKGQLLAGLDLSWSNLDMYIDIMQPWKSQAAGFQPTLEKQFKVTGQLSAGGSLGIPLSATFGINLLNGLFDLSVGLQERPSVGFDANFATATCGTGVGWALNVNNDVDVVYPEGSTNLVHWDTEIDHGCASVTKKRELDSEESYAVVQRGEFPGPEPSNCISINPNPNVNLTKLRDTTGKYILLAGADGNLWLGTAAVHLMSPITNFASANDVIAGDATRLLHWYPDTMTQFGISRIRLADLDHMPLTSQAITLVPTTYSGGAKPMYVATDTLGKTYFLAWCGYPDQGAKVVLVQDPNGGLNTLRNNEEARWTVLGGIPGECNLLGLNSVPFKIVL